MRDEIFWKLDDEIFARGALSSSKARGGHLRSG